MSRRGPKDNGRQSAKQRRRTHERRYNSHTPKNNRVQLEHEPNEYAVNARRFAEADSDQERFAIVCETEMTGTDAANAVAGMMLLDMAMRNGEIQGTAYFEEGRARLEKSLANQGATYSDPAIARGAVMLAYIDMFRHQMTDKQTMPPSLIEAAYERNLGVASAVAASYQESTTAQNPHADEYLGLLGEQSITLLLGRFSMNHMEGSWFVQPALYSEDHAMPVGDVRHSYDVKVLAQDDPSFMYYPAYRIQSKTGTRYEKKYAPHITVVHALADLAIDYEGRAGHVAPHIVPAECLFEYEAVQAGERSIGDIAVSERLDKRTDKLLDVLG